MSLTSSHNSPQERRAPKQPLHVQLLRVLQLSDSFSNLQIIFPGSSAQNCQCVWSLISTIWKLSGQSSAPAVCRVPYISGYQNVLLLCFVASVLVLKIWVSHLIFHFEAHVWSSRKITKHLPMNHYRRIKKHNTSQRVDLALGRVRRELWSKGQLQAKMERFWLKRKKKERDKQREGEGKERWGEKEEWREGEGRRGGGEEEGREEWQEGEKRE